MTTDERIENLEKGLASARRFNRWLLAAVGLALGVWILAGTLEPRMAGAEGGAAAVNEVRAKKFVLVDDAGKVHAGLAPTKDGAGLILFDEAGKTRAMLSVGALGLYDAEGKTRVMLSVGADGPALGLFDAAGKTRAGLSVGAHGPGLVMADENGKGRVGLTASKVGGAGLDLYDAAGRRVWSAP